MKLTATQLATLTAVNTAGTTNPATIAANLGISVTTAKSRLTWLLTNNQIGYTITPAGLASLDENKPKPPPPPPSPGSGGLPTPAPFTPTSTASGTITYHCTLPATGGDQLTLSTNHTDLIISNFVAGALLGRLLKGKNPNLVIDRDYIYGTMFAQLLQENIDTAGYSNTTDWINPDAAIRGMLLSMGQGGPYQINDYSKRLEDASGIGLVNFVALQKGLGYGVAAQDSGTQTGSRGPDSLDSKYFGPMAAAYFHLNDYNRLVMNNVNTWGPQHQSFAAAMVNLTLPDATPMLDLILNATYNAGPWSRILTDLFRICALQLGAGPEVVQAGKVGDYSLSDAAYQSAIGTSESAGSTFILYPRQVRLYLDQMYNKATHHSSVIRGDTSINLSIRDIAVVFANSMGTLAYQGASGYDWVAPVDASAAFNQAVNSLGLAATGSLDIGQGAHRAVFFDLLDTAIGNLAARLGTDFGAVTQTTL